MTQKHYRTIHNYTMSMVNFSDMFIYGIGTTSQSTGVSSAIFVTRTPAHTVNASWQGTGPWFRKGDRSEEHTSELQSLMRISYAVFCLQKKKSDAHTHKNNNSRTTNTDTCIG